MHLLPDMHEGRATALVKIDLTKESSQGINMHMVRLLTINRTVAAAAASHIACSCMCMGICCMANLNQRDTF
jgi:hypothetical protein